MSSERIPGMIPGNAGFSTMSVLSVATEDDDMVIVDSKIHYVHNKNLDLIAITVDDHLRNYVASVSSFSRGTAIDKPENQKRSSTFLFCGGLTIQRLFRDRLDGQKEHDNIWKIIPKSKGKYESTMAKDPDSDADTKTTECTTSHEPQPWELRVRVCDVAHSHQQLFETPQAPISNATSKTEERLDKSDVPGLTGTSMSSTQTPPWKDTETNTITACEQHRAVIKPTTILKKWEGHVVQMQVFEPTATTRKQEREHHKLLQEDLRTLWYDLVGELLRKCELTPVLSHKKNFTELYEVNEEIKSGAYGVVCRGKNTDTDEQCAIKIIAKNRLSQEGTVAVLTEAAVLASLQKHPNIVHLIDFFEQDQSFILVMELCEGGDLFDRVGRRKTYTECDARDLSIILLEVLRYCHQEEGIAHLDLKPVNLLLKGPNDDADINLADFGLACRVISPASLLKRRGTPYFIAPEIIKERPYDQQADMWSLGVIIYILLGGGVPFTGNTRRELFRSIETGKFTFPEQYWSHVSSHAKEFIKGLLVLDPDQRMTAKQALQSPWIQGVDGHALAKNDLSSTSKRLRTFNARLKLKAVILGIAYLTISEGFCWAFDNSTSIDGDHQAADGSNDVDGSEVCSTRSAANSHTNFSCEFVDDPSSPTSAMDTITGEQMEEYRELFSLFDKNGDGVITTKELLTVFHLLGICATEKNAATMIKTIDTNRNGAIDFSEFLGFLLTMTQNMRDSGDELRMERAFEIFDKDHDGFISSIELRSVMDGLGALLTNKEIDDMIQEADTDRDGSISYEEFKQFVMDELPLASKSAANKHSSPSHDTQNIPSESTCPMADALFPSKRVNPPKPDVLLTDKNTNEPPKRKRSCRTCGTKISRPVNNDQCIRCCSKPKGDLPNERQDEGSNPVRPRKRDVAKQFVGKGAALIMRMSKSKSPTRESFDGDVQNPAKQKNSMQAAQHNDTQFFLDGLYSQKSGLRFHQTARINNARTDVPLLAGSVQARLRAYELDLPDLEEVLASDLHGSLGHRVASRTYFSKSYIDDQSMLQAFVLEVNVHYSNDKEQQHIVEIVGDVFELQAHDEIAWSCLKALDDQASQPFLTLLKDHFSQGEYDPSPILEQESSSPRELACRKYQNLLDNTKDVEEVKDDGMFVTIVNLDNEEYIVFDVQANDTVLDTKEKVFELENIPTDLQDLFYHGTELQDDKLLSDYGLFFKENSEPELERELELRTCGSNGGSAEIIVRPVTGGRFRVNANRNDSIFQLKVNIEYIKGIPASEQHLVLGEATLDNSRSLSFYDIRDESILRLVPHMCGSADRGTIPTQWPFVRNDTDPQYFSCGLFVEKKAKHFKRTFKTTSVHVCLKAVAGLVNLALSASGLALPSLDNFLGFLEACADQEDVNFGVEHDRGLVEKTWIHFDRSTKTFRALDFVMETQKNGMKLGIGTTNRVKLKVSFNAYYLQADDNEACVNLGRATSIAPPVCFRCLSTHFRLPEIRMQAPAAEASGTNIPLTSANQEKQIASANMRRYDEPSVFQILPDGSHVAAGNEKDRMRTESSPSQLKVCESNAEACYCQNGYYQERESAGNINAIFRSARLANSRDEPNMFCGIPNCIRLSTQSSDTGADNVDVRQCVDDSKQSCLETVEPRLAAASMTPDKDAPAGRNYIVLKDTTQETEQNANDDSKQNCVDTCEQGVAAAHIASDKDAPGGRTNRFFKKTTQ